MILSRSILLALRISNFSLAACSDRLKLKGGADGTHADALVAVMMACVSSV